MDDTKLRDTTDKLINDVNEAIRDCIIDAAKEAKGFNGVNPMTMKYVGHGLQVLNTLMDYTKALTDELIEQHKLIEKLEYQIDFAFKKEKCYNPVLKEKLE